MNEKVIEFPPAKCQDRGRAAQFARSARIPGGESKLSRPGELLVRTRSTASLTPPDKNGTRWNASLPGWAASYWARPNFFSSSRKFISISVGRPCGQV